jgi:transcriptional regulator with XRE-family HTH domain
MTANESSTNRNSELRNVGARLHQVIRAAGLSQAEFAHRVGASPSFVNAMVRGTKMPGIDFLHAIHQRYEISIDWLVTGTGGMFGTAAVDLDGFRLSAALVYLAERWEIRGDRDAASLGEGLANGTIRIDSLSAEELELLHECERATAGFTFSAYVYNEHREIRDPHERVAATMRSARAHAQVSRPFRVHSDPVNADLVAMQQSSAPRLA